MNGQQSGYEAAGVTALPNLRGHYLDPPHSTITNSQVGKSNPADLIKAQVQRFNNGFKHHKSNFPHQS
jgi:hypothetical protein